MILLALIVAVAIHKMVNHPIQEAVIVDSPAYGSDIMPVMRSDLTYTVPDNFKPINCSLDDETQEFAYYIAKARNIDFTFMMAVMDVESGFDCNTISSTGDYGLFQINKKNHEWLKEELGIDDFLDPYQNIIAGSYILERLFEKYEDTTLVLMAYNMGESGASVLWDAGIYETDYTRAVFETVENLQWGEA
ncbi:MAG: transglycosylase SLT domain-containing protein [Holdemanella sp.]|nr:transglycosylase SLT domain-containing protein [Holdemanella sp.]